MLAAACCLLAFFKFEASILCALMIPWFRI